jgi:putative transposase
VAARCKQLRRDGHRVNDRRVQRLRRAEGLKAPYRKWKKPRGDIGASVGAFCPATPNAL